MTASRHPAPATPNMAGDKIAGASTSIWDNRWGPLYGKLAGPLIGRGSAKTLNETIGLIVVVVGIVLTHNSPPEACRADLDLRTDRDGHPERLVLSQEQPERRRTMLVELTGRHLRIGGHPRVFLGAPDAAHRVLTIVAHEAGAFFGPNMREGN